MEHIHNDTTAQMAWTNLKEILNVMRDGSGLCPPLKAALAGVTAIMDSIDRVGDVNDEFVRIANNVKGFQGIFSQYGAEKDISPAMCKNLDAVTSSVITALSTAASHNLVSRKLKLIEENITEYRRERCALEAPGDVEKVVIAFKNFEDAIDRFQLDMGLLTPNYYVNMNVSGGVGGAGGRSEQGTGGNGGIGQGPTLNISTTHCTVNNLSTDAFEKLGCIDAADIDAQSPEGCLKGTRVDLLADLLAWSRDPDSPRIFWLDGMAGTGKSAIARSFCRMLREDKHLGGSFFCLRGNVNQGNLKRILPTLARHLASQHMTYKWALLAALDTGISWNANLEIQVEKLLVKPLRSTHGNGPPTMVLVIDALDELDDEDATKDLLRRLVAVVPRLPIKLFVTSRPERHIRPHFETAADLRRVLRLHDIEDNIVTADISLYLMTCLDRIRAENSSILPPTWASPADIEVLTRRAGRLFIYASTVMKYIGEKPRVRLQTLISIKVYTNGPLTKALDDIYRHILSDAMDADRLESDEIALTRRILAAVLTVGQPVSVATLGGLLGVPAWQVREMLARLHAVIHVPVDDYEGVLSTFHASFGDFLTTTGRASDEMLIKPSATHAALFSDCIRIMDSELRFNVSNCPTSYFPNVDHKLSIPALLQYVCLYWPHHISAAPDEASVTSSQLDSLKDVLLPKFLFWVEVLSAMNKASVASNLIMIALTAKCFVHAPRYLTEFLVDANEFVVSSLEAIETSVAHIYLSALPCLRPTSKVAKAFWPKFNCLPLVHLAGIQRRQEAALILKSPARVNCIAFSVDGAFIVSGSKANTICLWDARTGHALMEPIQGHTDSVFSVAFSPDGAYIASGSQDNTIRVWDARTGKAVIEPIQGHTDLVFSVAFSPDGRFLASGSRDNTIRVWDVRTGKAVMEPIRGHTDAVFSVVFSPDGASIASGSRDNTICVWAARMGKALIAPIRSHRSWVHSVAFSPGGAFIASGSSDNAICVSDARTGSLVMKPILGHTDAVKSVVFSSDGGRIVSGSDDNTIRVWDARTGKAAVEPIQGHTDWVNSVAFSPCGASFASGSYDQTIRVWDARMGEAVIEPISGHTGWVHSVAFSPDGALIASGSSDNTIHVSNARTGNPIMKPIRGHEDAVKSVVFSPDGELIASGSDDHTIGVWNARTGKKIIEPLQAHGNPVHSVAFSPDGAYIVSGSYDQIIRVWHWERSDIIFQVLGHPYLVQSVASGLHSPTNNRWGLRMDNIVEAVRRHLHLGKSFVFSPDGAYIAAGSGENTIHVWDARTGKAVTEPIQGHSNLIESVAFSPDGGRILSGSGDNTIRVWDATTGKATMEPFWGHTNSVKSVVFSPDGARIASGSVDHTIRVWDVTTGVIKADQFSQYTVDLSAGPVTLPHEMESWIRGPNQELIMWVPPEYRRYLQLPPRFIVIACARVIVDMDRFVHGGDWVKCYTG